MKTILSIMVLALLSGCGGGSGGGSAVPQASPTTRPIITHTLRTFQNGDFILYNLTGRITVGGVVSSVLAGTGKLTYTLQSPADPLGNTHSSETYVPNITSNGVPLAASTTVNYFDQLANGTFRFWGDNSSQWITSPIDGNVTRFLSPIVIGNTWNHTYILQSGEKIIETIIVDFNAFIMIPLGAFDTIQITKVQERQSKANVNAPYVSFQTSSEKYYIVPSIGIMMSQSTTSSMNTIPATSTYTKIEATTTNIAF